MSNVIELRSRQARSPIAVNGKVAPPKRRRNVDSRTREHLTPDEVEKLLIAARSTGRYSQRDEALVLIAYRHGFRVSELVALRWEQIELKAGLMHVTRRKNGTPSTHTIQGDELRALRRVLKSQEGDASPYVFTSERGGPMTDSNVRKLIARLGGRAGFAFPVHPHQLRHACGYALAEKGHDTRRIQLWLGHKNITHTVRYTQLSSDAFRSFWRD